MAEQFIFDDGSVLGWDASGTVMSKDVGSNVWVDDPAAAPAGWNVFAADAQEQARLAGGYPANGASWSDNASMLGITRLIDTAARAYSTVKGSTAATYAGQNGQTYANGQTPQAAAPSGLGMLLILGALALVLG